MAKILIIDDEKQMNEYIKAYLGKRGFEIAFALSGQEALDTYAKENPQVILLDLGLPDMDGREVLKKIKEQAPQIKIVVISAYNDENTKDEMIQLGADYFLGKPFIPPALHELLKNIVK
ncbi:MAG: response regulator [Candidatus Omnitrophota bacterium]